MKSNLVSKISSIVYALIIALFGFNHVTNAGAMTGMIPSYLPVPVFWVYLTGTALLLAAIAIIINKQAQLAGYLLGLLLVLIVLTVHLPNLLNAKDEAAKMLPMTMIMKDMAMAAAAFFIGSKAS